ncbi:Regulator of chromosome condensation (RCC1) repeat protein [Enhygromyxa salina]|uniref:Regulator of chromosome condensation (RCC1) repeat protein n=1 Tax=Enhygromyxa salina TaxID=215803 RepID=A0A2S9YE86_9BACT|nr:hypothetical protein [Enhygromyxa salina]PRQ03403.1 Regulator of chromosome condensation (RCC1) repeat protein [Enhygromyxa salina]
MALSLSLGCDWSSSPTQTPKTPAATPAAQPPTQSGPTTPSVDAFVEVAAGNQHSCARRQSGAVMCWGRNTYGQLGNGARDDSKQMVAVTGLRDAVEVEAGGDFSCARRKSGSVVCWGNNQDGQLGDGRGAKVGVWSTKPTGVTGLSDAIDVGVGEAFACALRRGGKVVCWGVGANGQVGTGGERAFPRPMPITGISTVTSLAVGGRHVCVAETSGRVMCWGRNSEGQLGDGDIASRFAARPVLGLSDAEWLVAGGRHTCARRRSGGLACWGDGREGQLGLGPGTERVRTAKLVGGVSGWTKLVAGDQHTCALFSDADLRCWGDNSEGQIDASRRPRPTPSKVAGVRGVVDVAAGTRHTCVVSGGKVYCWGLADRQALGPNPRG